MLKSMSKRRFVAPVAVFAMSLVVEAQALASPEWYVKKAGVFEKVKEPVDVVGTISWELIDTGTGFEGILEPGGIACSFKGEGEIKPGGVSSIKSLTEASCRPLKRCVGIEKAVELDHFPWKTELYTEGSEVRDRIVNGGSGEPSFRFTCKFGVTLRTETDECLANTSTHTSNNASGWVEAAFDTKSAKTNCTLGGKGAGEWKGSFATIKPPEKSGIEAIKAE